MKNLSVFILLLLIGCSTSTKKENDDVSNNGVIVLAPKEFKSELSAASNPILIDVRKPEELTEGIIKGAINIDFSDTSFTEKMSALDKETTYFVYCKSGKRSWDAVKQMEESGFKKIYTLDGGYNNWIGHGLETVIP